MSMLTPFALLLLAQGPAAPREIRLTTPDRVLSEEFTQIRGVRELRDGRVLISDRLDKGVVAADLETSTVLRVGRTGRGPAEYRLPTALLPMAGDSTLLVDEGNSRLAVIGPDLRIHRSFLLMLPGVPVPLGTRGVDRQGRFYLQIPGWVSARADVNDSLVLVRFDMRRERVDTLARVKGATMRTGPAPTMRLPIVPFAPQDGWAVSTEGRLAIVRAADYHVELLEPDGRVTRGPVIPFDRVPVTEADRIAYTRRFTENSSVGGKDSDGGLSPVPNEWLEDRNLREFAARNVFAETKPPFTDAAVHLAPEGTLWVERSLRLGAPSTWDVFDRAGRLAVRVILPRGRRLAALGDGTLYLVATDEDGIQRLERYRRD
ncbi:MAG TPA: hypothetical protein VLE53_16180 [Gemmatimonadaceae bacterium]|nr:hypothetical protein [Gemmatimonadaceae bacterium]